VEDLLRVRVETHKQAKGTTVQLLTIAEVAETLKVSEKTVRREIAAGNLASVPIRGAIRIDKGDLDIYLASRRKQKPPEKTRGARPKRGPVTGGFQFVGA
jgi:excisionase family DNA binding protein